MNRNLKTRQYLLSWQEADLFERVVREFLLDYCDVVRYTSYPRSWGIKFFYFIPFGIFIEDDRRDPRFLQAVEKLKGDLIKKITDNTMYNDVEQSKSTKMDHYFYDLSKKIKELLNDITLLNCPFGFNDPTFYRKDRLICSVISHEPIFVFRLTEKERRKLNSLGVVFD